MLQPEFPQTHVSILPSENPTGSHRNASDNRSAVRKYICETGQSFVSNQEMARRAMPLNPASSTCVSLRALRMFFNPMTPADTPHVIVRIQVQHVAMQRSRQFRNRTKEHVTSFVVTVFIHPQSRESPPVNASKLMQRQSGTLTQFVQSRGLPPPVLQHVPLWI